MASVISRLEPSSTVRHASRRATVDAPWLKGLLITVALGFLALFLVLPLVAVFTEALRRGVGAYFSALSDADGMHALKLTLLTAALAVPSSVFPARACS
jgi:sulfate/thiosulfate transport system permease protein